MFSSAAVDGLATDITTLQRAAFDVGAILEHDVGQLRSSIRDLAGRVLHLLPPHPRGATGLRFGATTLGRVERLILLRQQLPFARARLQALAALAHASDEIDWPGGTPLITPGQVADAGLVLIDGLVYVRRPDGTSFTLGPGESLGYLETLAAAAHSLSVHTSTPVRALRSTADVIHRVLEEHTDVAMSMLGTFSALLHDSTVN